ncbi:MAG: hypothetical protein JNK89_03190 [Saprospiraceae bacterium]|nr:hypothetical protein [Saprospiraceae bacterium]
MDFSKENFEAAQQADFAYAKWYAQLTDLQKAEFFKSGFDLVAEKIKRDVQQENPFATSADALMRFVELTQKDAYTPEVFDFVMNRLAEQSEKEWQERFKKMKSVLGWTYEDMAAFMNAGSGASVKASINRKLPAFAKLAVCVFEQLAHEKTSG